MQIAALIFWSLLAVPAIAVVGYPLVIGLWARVRRGVQVPGEAAALPPVTLVISVYNEQAAIRDRLENALSLDYPRHLLRILVASDGSTDATNAIVRKFESRGVRLLEHPERRGKSATLADAVAASDTDILVFTDANSAYDSDALRKLVRWFDLPRVGAVCGRLAYRDDNSTSVAEEEQRYWSWDNWIKKSEGSLGQLVAGNGSIIAIRREFAIGVPGHMANDFVWPNVVRLRGALVGFEPEAVAREYTAGTTGAEFGRRVRIINRGYHAVAHAFRYSCDDADARTASGFAKGYFLLQLTAKKLFRYLSFPAVLLAMMLVPVLPMGASLFAGLFLWACLGIFVLVGLLRPLGRKVLPFWPDPFYAIAMVAASGVALVFFLTGHSFKTWSTHRSVEVSEAA